MSKESYSNLPVGTLSNPPPGNPERYKHVYKGRDGEEHVSIQKKKNIGEILMMGLVGAVVGPPTLILSYIGSLLGMKNQGHAPAMGDRMAGGASIAGLVAAAVWKPFEKVVLAAYGVFGGYLAVKHVQDELKNPYEYDFKATNDYNNVPQFKNTKDKADYMYKKYHSDDEAKKTHQEKLAESRGANVEVSPQR